MSKISRWFQRHTQQAVMSRASAIPIIAKSGPSAKTGHESVQKKPDEGIFLVGVSEVGGSDRVGGKKR
jgi:hypothetical protein